LIPLGFAGSFAAGRGQEIAKVGAMSVIEILQQLAAKMKSVAW
jgi:hypothetical protein